MSNSTSAVERSAVEASWTQNSLTDTRSLGMVGALLLAVVILAFQFRPRGPKLVGGVNLSAGLGFKDRLTKWVFESPALLQSGYLLLKQGLPFVQITIEDGTQNVVFNHRYLKDLRAMSDDHLSFDEAVKGLVAKKYTRISNVPAIGQDAIRGELTTNLPRLLDYMSTEVDFAFNKVMPKTDEWQLLPLEELVLEPIAQASARLFVGPNLCRDERWMHIMRTFTHKTHAGLIAVKMWPPFLRPLVWPFIPSLRIIEKTWNEGRKILEQNAEAEKAAGTKGDYIREWVADKNPEWADDVQQQVDFQFTLSMSALHTTSMTLTHLLLDLAAYPEYADILREEMIAALHESVGKVNNHYINKLVKLDSFMKESQRLNPLTLYTFQRMAMQDLNLSDGTHVPQGTFLVFDSSQRYLDGDLYSDPAKFDGLRFYRLREADKETNTHLFVTSNLDNLAWGQGKHACPGRFFAGHLIKVILTKLLLQYDVALEEGKSRPENLTFGAA
ncbi:Cytochrome P450, partial [Macrophomina phaseolina MS6]